MLLWDVIKNILISKGIDIKIFSGNTINLTYNRTSNEVTNKDKNGKQAINVYALSPSDIKKIQSALRQNHDRGMPILKDSASDTIDDIKVSKINEEHIIQFFQKKIDSSYIGILKAAIYIDYLYKQGEPKYREMARKHKTSLAERHGSKANNIINLYSAGYFKTVIQPLYKEMEKESNFTLTMFVKAFEEIVTKAPFTVFVHEHMSQKDVNEEVSKKFSKAKQYNAGGLHIHGIGKRNIQKIQEALEQEDIKKLLPAEGADIDKQGAVIRVTVKMGHPLF